MLLSSFLEAKKSPLLQGLELLSIQTPKFFDLDPITALNEKLKILHPLSTGRQLHIVNITFWCIENLFFEC